MISNIYIHNATDVNIEAVEDDPFSHGGLRFTFMDTDGFKFQVNVEAADPFAAKRLIRSVIDSGHDAAMVEIKRVQPGTMEEAA